MEDENEVLYGQMSFEDVDDWTDAVNDSLVEIGDKPIEDENEPLGENLEEKQDSVVNNEEVVEETPSNTDEFEIVYNGEKMKVNKEQAIPLIQKGMNYDKLNDKYENDKARAFIKKLAEREGKSVDEYINLTDATIQKNDILEIAEEEGISEELAKEIYNSREKNRENAFANVE